MSFQGPSCDALTVEWCRSVGVLAISGALKLGAVLVILIVFVLALFDFRCLILL